MGMTGHRNGTARRPARSSASAFPQVKDGAASGTRTPDLRRTPLHRSKRATSTHATSQRTDSTPRSGQTVLVMPTVMPHRQRGSGGGAVGAHGPGGERPAAGSTPPACRSQSRSPAPTGTTRCSSSRWYLVPSLPRSTGLRPVSSPPFRPRRHRIDDGPGPVQQPLLAEGVEHLLMQPVPNPSLLPNAEPPPAGHRGSAAQLAREHGVGGAERFEIIDRHARTCPWGGAGPVRKRSTLEMVAGSLCGPTVAAGSAWHRRESG